MTETEKKFMTVVDDRVIWYKTAQEQDIDYYDLRCERYITCYDENGNPAYGCVADNDSN